MVLLEGIELSTFPLPRECSTTELQQPGSRLAAFIVARRRSGKSRAGLRVYGRILARGQAVPENNRPREHCAKTSLTHRVSNAASRLQDRRDHA